MKLTISRLTGFSLVEVTLAVGIAAFCLLSIMALFPTSLATNQITIQQTVNTNLVAAIAADLRATAKTVPSTDQNSPRYGITIPASIVGAVSSDSSVTHTIFLKEDGASSGAQDTDADPSQDPRYRATITFITPNSASPTNPTRKATKVNILFTWPALADKIAATAPTKYTGSYEVFIALDRN